MDCLAIWCRFQFRPGRSVAREERQWREWNLWSLWSRGRWRRWRAWARRWERAQRWREWECPWEVDTNSHTTHSEWLLLIVAVYWLLLAPAVLFNFWVDWTPETVTKFAREISVCRCLVAFVILALLRRSRQKPFSIRFTMQAIVSSNLHSAQVERNVSLVLLKLDLESFLEKCETNFQSAATRN